MKYKFGFGGIPQNAIEMVSIVSSTDPFGDGSLIFKMENESIVPTVGATPNNWGATFDQPGKFGNCATFDGISQYYGNLSSGNIGTAKTLSFWTNKPINRTVPSIPISNSNHNGKFIFMGPRGTSMTDETFGLQLFNDTYYAHIKDVIDDTTWKHIIIEYDETNYNISINNIDREMFYNIATHANTLGEIDLVGKYSTTTFFDGQIDQLEYYNRLLTPEEKTYLFEQMAPAV